MRRRWRKFKDESLATWRRRVIHETELALHLGLRFPERVPRIPTIEVGKGEFDPMMSGRVWEEALAVDIPQPVAPKRSHQNRLPHLTAFTLH